MADRPLLLAGVGLWLLFVAAVGLPHAVERHFHVDEIQVAYNVALWGLHDAPELGNYAMPFMVPSAWLVAGAESTATVLVTLRLAFFTFFLLELVAVALFQPYFRSAGGRLAVLLGVTWFHSFWLHGFEIRHDTLLAAGCLLLYGLAQRAVAGGKVPAWVPFAAGAVAAGMQLHGFKAFLYWVPFGGLVLVFCVWRPSPPRPPSPLPPSAPPQGEGGERQKSAEETVSGRAGAPLSLGGGGGWDGRGVGGEGLRAAAGFLAGAAAIAAFLAAAGRLDVVVDEWRRFFAVAGGAYDFSPTPALLRLVLDSPLVFGAAGVFLVAAGADLARRRLAPRSAVTAAFLLWSLVALYLNPTPFAYNFLYLCPFAFLAALDLLSRLLPPAGEARRLAVATLLTASCLFFFGALRFHPQMRTGNAGQLSYAAAAEALTDPVRDTVLDGAGLVATRRPPGADWMLHSLFMPDYQAGKRTSFRQLLLEDPSPVLITNYRWRWLSPDDLALRDARYLRLHEHLWVLGARLPAAEGDFQVHRSGRYLVPPSPAPAPELRVDGAPIPPGRILHLEAGRHRYAGAGDAGLIFHWIGPRLDAPPAVEPLPGGRMYVSD